MTYRMKAAAVIVALVAALLVFAAVAAVRAWHDRAPTASAPSAAVPAVVPQSKPSG